MTTGCVVVQADTTGESGMSEKKFGLSIEGMHIDCLTTGADEGSSSNSSASRFQGWKADTCCGMHMTGRRELFQALIPLAQPITIRCAYGTEGQARWKGSIRFKSPIGGTFVLHHVLYTPGLQHNLLSADMLRQEGYYLTATREGWLLLDDEGKSVSRGVTAAGEVNQVMMDLVTCLPGTPPLSTSPELLVVAATVTQRQETPGNQARWHQRLGHATFDAISQLRTHNLVTGMLITAQPGPGLDTPCPGCVVAKARQQPFRSRPETSQRPLDIVHADLLNPLVKSWDGKQYILMIVDQFSRYLWAYPISLKSDAAAVIRKWHLHARIQSRTELKTFRTDRGGEFLGQDLLEWWDCMGVTYDYSLPDSPQQNGLAERNNQTVMMKLRAAMIHMDIPDSWWTLALPFVTYLRNVLPSAHLPRTSTPYLRLYGRQPDISMVRVFGCMCLYKVPENEQGKLRPRARWGIHVGLCNRSKGWRILDIASRKLTDSRNVCFYEDMSFTRWNDRYNGQTDCALLVPDNEFSNWPRLNAPLPYSTAPPEEDFSLPMREEPPSPPASLPAQQAAAEGRTALEEVTTRLVQPPEAEEDGVDSLGGAELLPAAQVVVTGRAPYAWPRELPPNMPSRPTPPEHVSMPGKESDYSGVELEGMTGRMAEGRLLQALGERADLGISLAGELIAIDNSKGGGGLGEELGKGKRIKKAVTRLNLSVEVASQTGEGSSAAPPPKAPQSWREAMALPDAAEWRKAAEEEMGMLSTLKVWEAVELPPGRKAISCRWVFTKKKQGETYSLYKARLVAKGYEQQRGDDYEETWAPTVSHVTVRCLLAVAVKRGYSIWQCDVKTAFLHGLLDKSNFLQQPEGFEDGTRRVWQLYKSLYGLKQSPRCWFQALREVLRAAGFRGSSADPALFLRGVGGVSLWVAVYVDDLLIVSAEEELCELTYKYLELHFTMKRILPVHTYLGLQLQWGSDKRTVVVHQKDYSGRVAARIVRGVGGVVDTPLAQGVDWKGALKEEAAVTEKDYKSLLGTLSYLSSSTRPDLTYSYSKLAQGTPFRGTVLVKQLERAAEYFIQNSDWGLMYGWGDEDLLLKGYCDADFVLRPDKSQPITETEDHKLACSTTGWVILLGGTAVSWKSCKQSSPSDSVCEAEYRSALDAAKEVVWLRFLLEELGEPQPAVPLYIDNDACQKLIEGESTRGETRHLVRQYLILRSMVKEGEIEPRHVSGKEQAADFLTKVVPPRPFLNCKRLCGMVRMQSASQAEKKEDQDETSVWLQRQGEKPSV